MLICAPFCCLHFKDIFADPINIAGRVRNCIVFDHHDCNFPHPPHHHPCHDHDYLDIHDDDVQI